MKVLKNGFPGVESSSQALQRALAFVVNVTTIVVGLLVTYGILRFKGKALDKTSN